MTDIPVPSGAPATQPATPSSTASEPQATAITSDFETFLRMLTAQVQNQDPLNPLDSTDFAVQLATFSGVEQQVRTNTLLEDMIGQLVGTELQQFSGWVGMEARAAGPTVFDGAPVQLEVAPEPGAARAELRVLDTTGQLWDRLSIPVRSGPMLWEGVRANGTGFPPGIYDFEVVSFDAEDEVIETSLAQTYNRISEVRVGPDGPELLLSSSATVPPDAVSALRVPF